MKHEIYDDDVVGLRSSDAFPVGYGTGIQAKVMRDLRSWNPIATR